MNDPISEEVWDFFCEKLPRKARELQEMKEANSEMEWFVQTEEMRSKMVRATVSKLEDAAVLIKIPLMTQIFQLTMRKPEEDFPNEAPLLSGDFIEGFDDFEWSNERSLLELSERFTDYVQALDVAILEIRDADNDGFPVEKLEIDEDESKHLYVRFNAVKYREIVTMSITIDNFQSFPRVLRCSNTSRMSNFDCEKWVPDEKLSRNLRRFYGEINESPQKVRDLEPFPDGPEKDSFDDDEEEEHVEMMDFI